MTSKVHGDANTVRTRKRREARVQTERHIEETVCKWAEKRGWLAIKFTPRGDRGWPDRIFISPSGVHVWVEFKRRGARPRKLQEFRLNELRKRNAYAFYFDDIDEAILCLEVYQ